MNAVTLFLRHQLLQSLPSGPLALPLPHCSAARHLKICIFHPHHLI